MVYVAKEALLWYPMMKRQIRKHISCGVGPSYRSAQLRIRSKLILAENVSRQLFSSEICYRAGATCSSASEFTGRLATTMFNVFNHLQEHLVDQAPVNEMEIDPIHASLDRMSSTQRTAITSISCQE